MAVPGAEHRKRFKRWQNLAPPQTRYLSNLLDTELIPKLEALGFQRVNISRNNPEWPVSGSEISLERVSGAFLDSITINFEKYRTPRFQIHASRSEATQPHTGIRGCNFVARSSQYCHFWGRPWWLPTRFWSEQGSKRTVVRVLSRTEQLLLFLEVGERGSNISKRIETSATKKN